MPPQRKLQAEDILEQVLNDTDSDMSASSSDSESEASEDADEAGDVPHPARNNVPGFRPQVQQAPQNVSDGAAQDAGNNFVWHYYDIEDPYEPDWLPVYDRRQSILVDTSDFSPVDFFKCLLSGWSDRIDFQRNKLLCRTVLWCPSWFWFTQPIS